MDQYVEPNGANYLFAAVSGANYLFAAASPALVQRAKEAARKTQSRCLPGRWNEGGDVGMFQAVRIREWGIVFAQAFVVFVLVGWRVVRCCLARRLRSRKGQG